MGWAGLGIVREAVPGGTADPRLKTMASKPMRRLWSHLSRAATEKKGHR